MSSPLVGLRIVDLTSVVMGPYATQILGDLGADVIKVESPTGDTTRQVPPMRNPNMGYTFLHANRNKRSLVLDLKNPDGLAALMRILKTADVLIYNIRPKAMERLGISRATLDKVNPRLISVSLVGFGQDGPYASHPAYEDLIQGLTAVPSMLVDAGSEAPHYVPLSFNDRAVGLQAAIAILAAVVYRDKSGKGQEIEVPMFESMVQAAMGDHMGGLTFDPPNGPPGYKRQLNKDRRPYPTKDGYVCVIIYTDKHWQKFAQIVGQPDIAAADPRFRTIGSRTEHAEEVYAWIAGVMPERTTEEWLRVLREADIPAAPMHTLNSLVDDPHLVATQFFSTVEHPTEGRIKQMSVPTKWSVSEPSLRRPAPNLGEHSAEVLREAGLTEAEVSGLLASGASIQWSGGQ